MAKKIKIRIFLWLFFAIVLTWILYMAIVPFGKIKYVYDFEYDNSFISTLKPNDRVEERTGGSQKVIGNPVYFSLRTPRRFDTATLKLKYRSDNLGQNLLEAGLLVDKTLWRYELKPLQNKIIDKLDTNWARITKDGLNLWQREKEFLSIEDFLASSSVASETAVYNYSWQSDFLLPNYASSTEYTIIDTPLRGNWQLFTYLDTEDLDINLRVLDLNNNTDADRLDLNLYYQDKLVDFATMDDDGNASDNQLSSQERSLVLQTKNLPRGVYKLELRANDDIITKNIKSKQKKLAFIHKINIAREQNENISLFTNSRRIEITTIYPESLQDISFGDQTISIAETYRQFSAVLALDSPSTSSLPLIRLAKDGLTLSGNGLFSFATSSFFDPQIKKVDENLNINSPKIKYILAEYSPPKEIGAWRYSSQTFQLEKAYQENNTYSFIISIPGLRADDVTEDYLQISNIELELRDL